MGQASESADEQTIRGSLISIHISLEPSKAPFGGLSRADPAGLAS